MRKTREYEPPINLYTMKIITIQSVKFQILSDFLLNLIFTCLDPPLYSTCACDVTLFPLAILSTDALII